MDKIYIVRAYYFSDVDWKGHLDLVIFKTKELAYNFANGITLNGVRTFYKEYLVHAENLEEKTVDDWDRDHNMVRNFETKGEWDEHVSIFVFEAQIFENENDVSEQLKKIFY